MESRSGRSSTSNWSSSAPPWAGRIVHLAQPVEQGRATASRRPGPTPPVRSSSGGCAPTALTGVPARALSRLDLPTPVPPTSASA